MAAYWKVAVQPRHVDTELLELAASLAAIAIEHRHLTDRLAHQAEHDPLTGLANRAQLARTLDRWMREGRESGRGVSVVFIDLDRFKQINDHLGHAAGDAVLKFVVVLEAGLPEAEIRSREMLELLRAPVLWQGQELLVTASVGVSACSADVRTSEE
jgi:GGDEF domain-containing protein